MNIKLIISILIIPLVTGCIWSLEPYKLSHLQSPKEISSISRLPYIRIIYPNHISNITICSRSFLTGSDLYYIEIGKNIKDIICRQAKQYYKNVEIIESSANINALEELQIEVTDLNSEISPINSLYGSLKLAINSHSDLHERVFKTIIFEGRGPLLTSFWGSVFNMRLILTRSEHEAMQNLLDKLSVIMKNNYLDNYKFANAKYDKNFKQRPSIKETQNNLQVDNVKTSYEQSKNKQINLNRGSSIKSLPISLWEPLKAGKYYALLIAIEKYKSSSLSNLNQPIKDAKQIKKVLRYYTFDSNNIILLENPNRDEIIDSFDKLSKIITKYDNLLIFYAGHGYWDKKFKQGYWLPSNASKASKSKWLSNSTIRDYIRGIKTKHTLLISDACFSGGIFKTRKAFDDSAPLAAKELYKLPSRKAMTSGTLTEVPDKSLFLKYFIQRLQENKIKYLSSEQLFVLFKNAVINNSPLRQVPQYGVIREAGDEGGDFIFIRRKN